MAPPNETTSKTANAAKTNKKELKPQTLIKTVSTLLQTQQFYWFLGHVSVLVSFITYNITSFFTSSLFYYKTILLSVLFTYAIVLRQVHFRKATFSNLTLLKNNLIKDENFQYFTLALVFFLSCSTLRPLSGSVFSFAIFSLFHALTYFQRNLLSSFPVSLQKQQQLNTRINAFTSTYNEPALVFASNSELLLIANFILSIPLTPIRLFTSPLFAITNVIVFGFVVTFLKLRYDSNKYTQQVVNNWDLKVTQLLFSPQAAVIPQSIKDTYQIQFKNLLKTYLGPISVNNIVKLTGGNISSTNKTK